jgi:hypothetical protein
MLSDEHLFFRVGWTDIGATYDGSSVIGELSSSCRQEETENMNELMNRGLKHVESHKARHTGVTILNDTTSTVEVM